MENSLIRLIQKSKRLGIMGGTFDPIHYGHMVAAEMARTAFNLDYVLFIPTGTPPHKVDHQVTEACYRYKMVDLSIRDNAFFKLSSLEIDRDGPSYTIDTLKILQNKFPKQEIFFITGTDALKELVSWREPENIIRFAKVIGASRPGYDASEFLEKIFKEYPVTKERISELEVPALAISSTDIRRRVRTGKSIRYLLPEEVRLYIEKNNLYR
ncbi:MAG: nicotinate-nucleotide adenylyltransferase [Eubacteriales bacterium]